MTDFTTEPVDWSSATWGRNPVHVAAFCPDRHDLTEATDDCR